MFYTYSVFFAKSLGASTAEVIFAVSLQEVAGCIASFALGPIITRFGDSAVLLASICINASLLFAYGLWPSYGMLISTRLLAGSATISMEGSGQVIITRIVPARYLGRVNGLVEASWGLSSFAGFFGVVRFLFFFVYLALSRLLVARES